MQAPNGGCSPATLRAAAFFDWVFSREHCETLERWIVVASVLAFLAHLTAIAVARRMTFPPAFLAAAGTNYLAAIYTPFSLILFYEVVVMISAIPQSTTRSLATQYEIVSLIFIRGFFKDIASLDLEKMNRPIEELAPSLIDVSAGLLMFLLVTIFRRTARPAATAGFPPELEKFIARKKVTSLALAALLAYLLVQSIWTLEVEIFHSPPGIGASRAAFYSDVFTAMIFTDVLILLLSLLLSDRYESVFRNAAFVISAILIRFALTVAHPYGAALGVAGMLFGIGTVAIYNYNRRPA